MSDFLLEIYSEEVPSRMQEAARVFIEGAARDILAKENINLSKDQVKVYISPRRIALTINQIDDFQIVAANKIIGPRVGANEKAIQGFLKSKNIKSIEDLARIDHNKTKYYCYFQPETKISTKDIIKNSLEKIIAKTASHWPKIMRYHLKNSSDTIKWIRPVRNIVCMFDDEVLNVIILGIKSSNKTYGHFLYSENLVTIDHVNSYKETLSENFVIVDQNERKNLIKSQVEKILTDCNLEIIDSTDSEIFKEINGICEFPTALTGAIDQKFMDLPPEILTLTLKSNQKFICLKDSSNKLSQIFIFICDAVCDEDKLEKIINDNQKVAYARLQDAKFYIEEDLKKKLDEHFLELKNIVFHEKLGNIQEKTIRIENLAEFISLWIPHCQINLISDTAKFCKADLAMKTVAEFTSLQGVIGSYCAKKQGYDSNIYNAIKEHYLPTGNSQLPKTPLGAAISIADKVDNIVGLFLSNQKPTSSKDPYALRRSAIGALRICIDHNIQIPFRALVSKSLNLYKPRAIKELLKESYGDDLKSDVKKKMLIEDVVKFFIEKLKNILKEEYKYNIEVINNIVDDYINNLQDHKYYDVIKLINRIKCVSDLVSNKDNKSIIEVYKRSVNVLSIEERKDNVIYNAKPHFLTLKQKEEKVLYKAIKAISPSFKKMIKQGDYNGAFESLKTLNDPLRDFFDNVMVNDSNEKLRNNRLLILSKIRSLFLSVADLSKIEISNS